MTFPMVGDRLPDPAALWDYLREPAEFFAVPMPRPDELVSAISDFVATSPPSAGARAVSVTIGDVDGAPQILVSGVTVTPFRSAAVRVANADPVSPPHASTDPWWRRMAARTTSRAHVDQLERWLEGRGFADGVVTGVPLLGALVVGTGDDVVGVENPEPTSILRQLTHCGAVSVIAEVDACPPDVTRAWWVSPRFETHPVVELAGRRLDVDAVAPAFARWA